MNKKEIDILDFETGEIQEPRQEEAQGEQQYKKNTFDDVYLQDVKPMIKTETKTQEDTYKVEIFSESISLSEFCSIMLTNTEISFTSVVDVPSVYVNISGEYTKGEIIEIIQRVCNGVSCKFVESKNIYTIEKEVEGNISSMGVLGYRCKYVVPSTTEIINFLGKIKNVYVYVTGVNVVVVGSKQDLEVMQVDKEGNGETIPVKFWDIKKVSEIKKDAMIEVEVRVQPAINKSTGMPLLNTNAA
jgi:hypothetical protein